MIAMLLAAVLEAQPAPTTGCTAASTVSGFERWNDAPSAALAVGRRAALALAPAGTIAYAPPLSRPAVPGSYGGAVPLEVAHAGAYRIALSASAWIDVVQSGARLASGGHEHGPACSGIAKIVTFQLQPGRYVVQLSEAKAPALAMMVVATR